MERIPSQDREVSVTLRRRARGKIETMNQEKFANGRDCVFSRVRGTCDACQEDVDRLHILTRQFGWFCERCCPQCNRDTGELHLETSAAIETPLPSLSGLATA